MDHSHQMLMVILILEILQEEYLLYQKRIIGGKNQEWMDYCNYFKHIRMIQQSFMVHLVNINMIIKYEHERWAKTDADKKIKLEKLLKQKNNQLSIDDWIFAKSTHGIQADTISQISKLSIPGNLYAELADIAARITKAPEAVLYNTVHQKQLIFIIKLHKRENLMQKIIAIFQNVQQQNAHNIAIQNQSAFYPFRGGQDYDIGWITIEGQRYFVNSVQKVGKHYQIHVDLEVQAEIDLDRRSILRYHHTATHIVFAACGTILGPHEWCSQKLNSFCSIEQRIRVEY